MLLSLCSLDVRCLLLIESRAPISSCTCSCAWFRLACCSTCVVCVCSAELLSPQESDATVQPVSNLEILSSPTSGVPPMIPINANAGVSRLPCKTYNRSSNEKYSIAPVIQICMTSLPAVAPRSASSSLRSASHQCAPASTSAAAIP